MNWLRNLEDRWVLRALRRGHEPEGRRVLLFHQLFTSEAEAAVAPGLPFEGFTTALLLELILTLQSAGYRFVAPDAPWGGRQAVLTFDDGYASVRHALPICETYEVPLVLAVTTTPVATGRAFWWDERWHQLRQHGLSPSSASREINRMKAHPPTSSAAPRGELDRPLSVAELQALATHRLVTLANHTHTHPPLTRCTDDRAVAELNACADHLLRWCGRTPSVLCYPNGDVSDSVVSLARARGYTQAYTTQPIINTPATPPLRQGRFTLSGRLSLEPQLARLRTGLSLPRP